jgi:DNA (cytosine-5)-methyltransferase 1
LVGNAKGYAKMVVQKMRAAGYFVQVFLLNANRCGIPQSRERVFFVAARNDLNFPQIKIEPRHKPISAADALRWLAGVEDETPALAEACKVNKRLAELWPLARDSGSFGRAVTMFGGKSKLWSQVIINGEMPAPTITATDNLWHWAEPRRLTFLETKVLGSFPVDYEAKSEKIGKYMVGMSVPPRMMQAVAEAVRDQWLAK